MKETKIRISLKIVFAEEAGLDCENMPPHTCSSKIEAINFTPRRKMKGKPHTSIDIDIAV